MVPPMLKPVVTMPNTRRPPRLGERLHLSYGQVAWDDCHGEGIRMPAVTGAAKGKGRRTETSQARTRGAQVRRYGDLRILVQLFRRRARFTSAARW